MTVTGAFPPINISLVGIVVTFRFENPRNGLNSCANVNGASMTVTGGVTGGSWTGNPSHSLDFNNAEGLVSHSALGNNTPVTTRGLFTDSSGTLTVN